MRLIETNNKNIHYIGHHNYMVSEWYIAFDFGLCVRSQQKRMNKVQIWDHKAHYNIGCKFCKCGQYNACFCYLFQLISYFIPFHTTARYPLIFSTTNVAIFQYYLTPCILVYTVVHATVPAMKHPFLILFYLHSNIKHQKNVICMVHSKTYSHKNQPPTE